jgi:L-lactate dehydrogenase complex protein LldG
LAEQSRNSDARREMLAAIRRHLAASAPFDAVRAEHHAQHGGAVGKGRVIEALREPEASPVERFRQALEAVAGRCVVVRDVAEAAEAVREILEAKRARRVAVSDSELVGRVLARVNTDAELVERAAAADLFHCDVGLTGAQWAVAETGTLVLEAESERHRLVSLVPPVHVAVVGAGSVRQTLAEVLGSLGGRGRDRLSRTVTFVTGPSRTSDIELTLAIGVHGPGELYVVIIEGEGHD